MTLSDSQKLIDEYDEFLKELDQLSKPPWYENKMLGIKAGMMHPDFIADIDLLKFCDEKSVMRLYLEVRAHLCMDYGYDPEVVESFLSYAISKDISELSPIRQQDGMSVVDFEAKEMQPSQDPKKVFVQYERAGNIFPHVYIRLGRSVKRNDIEWFMDQYWDKYIDPYINTLPPVRYSRVPGTLMRDTVAYHLHVDGMKAGDVIDYIEKKFGKRLASSYYSKIVRDSKPKHNYMRSAKMSKSTLVGIDYRPNLMFNKNDLYPFYLLEQ